jgi:hypothetical protein
VSSASPLLVARSAVSMRSSGGAGQHAIARRNSLNLSQGLLLLLLLKVVLLIRFFVILDTRPRALSARPAVPALQYNSTNHSTPTKTY